MELKDRPDIIKGLSRLERPEELLATTWALDYYVPLYYQHENWFYAYVLPYEKLLIDENELSRLFNYLRLDKPKELMNIIRKPSVTTAEMVKQISPTVQLLKWRRHLPKEKISRILKVVNLFDLNFYDEKPEPDYNALKNWRP